MEKFVKIVFVFIFGFLENKETLSDVIKCNKQSLAYQQSTVVTDKLGLRFEDIFNQRLCNTKRNNVANDNVDSKSYYSLFGVALAFEGEKLVQKIA